MFSCDLRKWHQEEGPQEPRGQGQSPQLPHQLLQLHHLHIETLTLPSTYGHQCPTAAMIEEGVKAVFKHTAATRNGDDSHTSGTGARRNERTVRECTYQDFMKCQPVFFRGTEEVVNLTQWFERMETVFRISNCTVENQVKFATCTLLGTALTWWNSHARTVTNDVAYAMTWSDLKKMMTTKYCPRNEIKKIEAEMFPEEADKIERYVGGNAPTQFTQLLCIKSQRPSEAIEMATD
ncbi:reverse transcriptase domain-containing protein [Tanacetum coccineum]